MIIIHVNDYNRLNFRRKIKIMKKKLMKLETKARGLMQNIIEEEKGASHMVEIVVVIVIVIAVAGTLNTVLDGAVTKVFQNLMTFIG